MANVTDAAFRRMFVECGLPRPMDASPEWRGRPDVFWTEFVSVEALLSKGKERALIDLWYSEDRTSDRRADLRRKTGAI